MKNFKKFLTLVLAVMMVVSSMAFSASAATTKFEDIDPDNETLVEAVDLLNYMGVAKGKSETNFGADELVTREQFALFIYRLMKGGKDAPATSKDTAGFTDLEDPTYIYAIAWAKSEGIVNGKSATEFGPKDPIKLQEAYAMIVRALDWEEENDLMFPYGHIEVAEQEGVELDKGLDSKVGYTDELTRADMAILLYNAFFAETGIEEVDTREREIGSGDNATWVLEEYTTNPRLCEKAFDVVEVEYEVTATPNYYKGDAEATYDLGYDALYVEKVEDSEVNADATEAPNAAYLTAEDLGVEADELNDYFLGYVTVFVTIDDEEIEKVLFADCNMVKKTVTDLKLGEVSTNKATSYFDGEDAKLLSGKITAEGTEEMYVYNAPYSYAKETYATGASAFDKYLTRNDKNLKAISIEKMDEDDDNSIFTAVVDEIIDVDAIDETVVEEGFFADQALELVEAFKNVYYGGLYEADLYDVDGDGLYDYIDYKPYVLFQVDADDEEYFEDSDFEPGELSEFDLPYIYTNEATVVGEDFADEDVVIGYFSEANEFVKVAAVVKPTVTTIDSFSKRNGTLTLGNGDVVDAVSAWKLFKNDEDVVFDFDAKKEELVDASNLFTTDVIDDDDELELYIYEGILLLNTDVDTVSKFTENLFIPTEIKGIKEGPFDPATGSVTYYIYAYVDGDVKYVPVAIDEDIDNPIVDEDGNYNRDYTDTFCTYTVKDGVYTIVPLEFDLLADGDVEKEALSTDVTLLDDEKKEEQVFAADLGDTITKIAGSRFDIGFERSVDFKSFTKIIIRVYDEDEDEYEFVEYDAASFKKSLKEGVVLENMKAIISNNVDSETRENLVLLYAETDDLAFAGKADKNGYRIISNYDIGADEEGEWRNYYELYDPYTGAKVTDVASANSEKKAGDLATALEAGTIVELVEGMVDEEEDAIATVDEANLVWIAEVDEAEGYFVAVPYNSALDVKDEIDAWVEENADSAINDIYGEEIPGNFIDYDKNTVVSVMSYGEYNSSFWKWGTMSLSNMSAIAGAKKEVLCYNEKAEDRNGNYVTKYADYVKAYISVDADNLDDDENPVAEFIIVIVNGDEAAALDA